MSHPENIATISDEDYRIFSQHIENLIKTRERESLLDSFVSYGDDIYFIAAIENQLQVTKDLIEYKLGDYKIKNAEGLTPLMVAIIHENYEVAKVLYDAHIDSLPKKLNEFYNNAYKIDQELSYKSHDRFFNDLLSWMKKELFSSERIGKVLAKVTNCSTKRVVLYRHRAITESFLQSVSREINFNEVFETVNGDLKHTRVILNNAPRSSWSFKFCSYFVNQIYRLHKFKSGRTYLEGILTLEIFNDENTLNNLEEQLKKTKTKNVKAFLKYNLYSDIKTNCGRDLLASFIGECPLNFHTILKNEHIDVNGRGIEGKTPLHFAAENNMIENVRMLFQRGADPNAFDERGRTPLSFALFKKDYEMCVELLLLNGSNPLLISERFLTEFSSNRYLYYKQFIVLKKLVIAQLFIYKELGYSTEEIDELLETLYYYGSDKYIEDCRYQLKEFKSHDISESRIQLTFFTILVEKPENLIRYVNEEDVQKIFDFIESNEDILIRYYRDLLRKRAKDIVEMQFCKKRAIQIVCQFTGIHNPHHLVVNKIVDYFSPEDLRKFLIVDRQEESLKMKAEESIRKITKRFQNIKTTLTM